MNPEKRKSAVENILGKMSPKNDPVVEVDVTDESEDEGLKTAVSELFAAVKADDAKAGVTALRSFFEQLDAEPESERTPEPDDDEDDAA